MTEAARARYAAEILRKQCRSSPTELIGAMAFRAVLSEQLCRIGLRDCEACLRAHSRRNPGSCVPPSALRACGAIRTSGMRPGKFSHRPSVGSPKALKRDLRLQAHALAATGAL